MLRDVVVARGDERTEDLAGELRAIVSARLGKSFRPDRIVFVDELPKTRSAKIVRRAIRAAVLREDPGDLSSLENPAALEGIRDSLDAGRDPQPR